MIPTPSEGSSITWENSRWQQAPFNGGYPSSLFASGLVAAPPSGTIYYNGRGQAVKNLGVHER